MLTKKQDIIFNYAFMNTLQCLCMTLASLLVNVGHFTLGMYLRSLLQALIVNNLCTVVFRIPRLGDAICMSIMKSPERKGFGVCSGIVFATLNTFFMTTFMTLLNVGANAAYFPAWLRGFFILEPVAICTSLIAAGPLRRLASKL